MTSSVIAWDFSQENHRNPYEARVITRIEALLREHYDERAEITRLWRLPSGYSNIGVYVVETAVRCVLVLQYGSTYSIRRENSSLDDLLALNGFAIVVEYRERVLGAIIDPTIEQMNEFKSHYTATTECWLEQCMANTGLGHPRNIRDLDILDAIFALFPLETQEHHLRAKCFIWAAWAGQGVGGEACVHVAAQAVKAITADTRERLYEWWKGTLDYTFPPPPDIDHEHPRTLARFLYKGETVRKIEVYGQVAVVPQMYEFFSPTTPGYDLVDEASGRRIAVWLPTNPGSRFGACQFAQALSRLVNWQQFDQLARSHKYALGVRVNELLEQTTGQQRGDQSAVACTPGDNVPAAPTTAQEKGGSTLGASLKEGERENYAGI